MRRLFQALALATFAGLCAIWPLYGPTAATQWLAVMGTLGLIARIAQAMWRAVFERDTWTRVGDALPPSIRKR